MFRLVLLSQIVVALLLPTLCMARQSYEPAQLLDWGETDWCNHDCAPFDRDTYFYCFRTGDEILIGSRRADWTWMKNRNGILQDSKSVSVRHDAKSISVSVGASTISLKLDYSSDPFHNPVCSAEVRKSWLKGLESIQRPQQVPAAARLVPTSSPPSVPLFRHTGSYFWVSCKLDPDKGWDACDVWGENAGWHTQLELVNVENHTAVPDRDLVIDPLATKVYYELHLQDGVVLKDWAKSRINNIPSPDSVAPYRSR